MKYYGTLGSACADQGILERMFACGMTGLRLNTSHSSLASAMDWILMADRAASAAGWAAARLSSSWREKPLRSARQTSSGSSVFAM